MTKVFQIGSAVAFTISAVLTVACGKQAASPVSPSGAEQAGIEQTAPGGLKASAPVPQSPTNGQKPTGSLVLVASRSTLTYSPVQFDLSYEFEILTPAGARVYLSPLVEGGGATVSHSASPALTTDQTYNWRVRAVYSGARGPWSTNASFVANRPAGYIRGNELYDPLLNCETVGTIRGPVTCIPGVGMRLDSFDSWIVYELPQALEQGEYSALVSGLETNTEGGKTRVFAMAEGYGDVSDNPARMTVEKRGDAPPGAIAWRFITSDDQIDTVGEAERVVREFSLNETYLFEASWRNSFFNVRIIKGGAAGDEIYEFGKHYGGFYRPVPHVVYAGGGPARGGPLSQSIPGMIIRQIWVSPNPRPLWANE